MPGVPSHGPECGTRTYPTRCRYCESAVFYFECSCGSQMLFDELGEPWPRHDCKLLPLGRKIEVADRRVGREATERYLADQMMAIRIDAGYADRIREAHREAGRRPRRPKPAPREIFREDPYAGGTTAETGFVRELIPDVDVYRKHGTPRTRIGAASLGELASGAYAQITIHTGALGDEDDFSFTFLIARRMLAEAGVRKGDLVRCRLRGAPILRQEPVWVCDGIERAV